MSRVSACWLPWLATLAACNVTPAATSGGAELPPRGACPRGIAVVSSDYQSTELGLLAPDGEVASRAFLSSASTQASRLAAPISGDVSVASAGGRAGELVVIDRFGTNVLTFVDTRTARVRAQLPIGTGFEANPQGYLAFSEHQAFVPRLGDNSVPGREPFDAGSDLLVVDPSLPRIRAAVPMPRKSGYLPSPAAVARLGGDVLVTLQHARANHSAMAEGELVGVDASDLSVRYRLALSGLVNCGRAELSPSGATLAIACSGFIDRNGAVAEPDTSGLLLLDALADPPRELGRLAAEDLAGAPLQAHVAFVSERLLLLKTQTALRADRDNQLFVLDLETRHATLLVTAARAEGRAGFGVALGGMTCNVACGDPCLVTDASRGSVLRFRVARSALVPDGELQLDGAGLPPRDLTPFF